MKLQTFYLSLFAALLFSSCSQVYFKQPEPSWASGDEKVFPPDMRGCYLLSDWGSSTINVNDTMYVTAKSVRFVYKEDKKSNTNPRLPDFSISDSAILKKDKKEYYLNLESKETKSWYVSMLKKSGSDLSLYVLLPDSIMPKLKAITAVTTMRVNATDTTDYIVNPTAAEFKQMLAQKLFTKTVLFHKIGMVTGGK